MAKDTRVSQYGQGFTNGVLIRGLPLSQVHPGRVFWVNNSTVLPNGGIGGSNGNDGSYLHPFSTIDYAVSQCTASRGDIVLVMPGYAQTITAAAEIGLDVAGVAVIGLGAGSLRPTITFATNATADIDVSAANISVQNMIFVANKADVGTCFEVTTAKDFTVEYCEFRDTSAILNFVNIVDTNTTNNAADGLYFCNNKIWSLGTTAATTAIEIDANISRMTVSNNFFTGADVDNTPCLVEADTFDMLHVLMEKNRCYRLSDFASAGWLIEGSTTASTGVLADNYGRILDAGSMLLITTGSTLGMFNNLVSGEGDKSGFVIPAIDADA